MRMLLCSGLLGLSVAAAAAPADDQRVLFLEQKLAQLERQVATQARRIDQLERAAGRAGELAVRDVVPPPLPEPAAPAWLIAANWDRVRPGMTELEVISILGAPNTIRGEANAPARTMLYALEIGKSGFLAGSVELRDGKAAAVHKPVLR